MTLADLLTVSKSTGRNGRGISAGRFPDCQQIYWQIYCHQICQQKWGVLSADIFPDSPNLLADLLTVSKSAGRNRGCISAGRFTWLSANLLTDLMTGGKSAGRNRSWLTKSVGRFTDCHQICQTEMGGISAAIFPDSPNLLADLLTVSKSAGRNGGIILLADFLTHQICWQIYWLSANLLAAIGGDNFAGRCTWLWGNLLAEMGVFQLVSMSWLAPIGGVSAGRFTDCQQISWQK